MLWAMRRSLRCRARGGSASACAALLFSLACGARTDLEALPAPRQGAAQQSSTQPPSGPPNASQTAPGKPRPDTPNQGNNADPSFSLGNSSELKECTLGVPKNNAQTCPFTDGTRCYPSSQDVCSCICPRDRGETICGEGLFPDTSGAIPVSCFTL